MALHHGGLGVPRDSCKEGQETASKGPVCPSATLCRASREHRRRLRINTGGESGSPTQVAAPQVAALRASSSFCPRQTPGSAVGEVGTRAQGLCPRRPLGQGESRHQGRWPARGGTVGLGQRRRLDPDPASYVKSLGLGVLISRGRGRPTAASGRVGVTMRAERSLAQARHPELRTTSDVTGSL